MANKQDARPFIDLQKDAEEFRAKFEEDIEKCKSILDAKITDLICDPDSLGNSRGPKQNALVEFSKAKYDIYISMKSLMNEMEREWLKYISEMKKLFIDNVEVFLANTKLEVKFPSTGSFLPPVFSRKSFGSNSTNVTGSIIGNIAKSIPGFTQKYDLEKERKEAEMVSVYDNLKRKNNSSPTKQNSLQAPSNITDLSENDDEEINESEQYVSSHNSRKGRFTDQRMKPSEIAAKDASSSESPSECESESTNVNSGNLNRSTFRSRSAAISVEKTNDSSESEEAMETETNYSSYNVSSRANKGRQASNTRTNTKAISEEKTNNSSESEEAMEKETNYSSYNLSSRANKGRQASNTRTNTKSQEKKTNAEPVCEDFNDMPVRHETSRGKAAPAKNGKNMSAPKRGRPSRRPVVSETVIEEDEELPAPQPSRSVSRRKTVLPTAKEVELDEEFPAPQPSRSVSRRKTVLPTAKEVELDEELPAPQPSRSVSRRKTVLPTAKEVELDEEPVAPQPSRSASRRKTLLPTAKEDVSGFDIIPGNRAAGRSKRKTIIGVSDLATEIPSKRLKGSNIQKIITTEDDEDAATDVNLLENGSYSEWISLKSIDGKIPTSPGIYEVKVWRAKKSAYIGFCDSLRQKLTIHNLKQNSGHKHLDKFIERNYEDIQIRYEVLSSVNEAKVEVKNRVNNFVAQHKTTPAYN